MSHAHDASCQHGAGATGGSFGGRSAFVGKVWRRRTDHYSELRTEATTRLPKVEMSHIGG